MQQDQFAMSKSVAVRTTAKDQSIFVVVTSRIWSLDDEIDVLGKGYG
jgi:hypothetical protein